MDAICAASNMNGIYGLQCLCQALSWSKGKKYLSNRVTQLVRIRWVSKRMQISQYSTKKVTNAFRQHSSVSKYCVHIAGPGYSTDYVKAVE